MLLPNFIDDSIFRNEAENKDDESMPAPARPQQTVVVPDVVDDFVPDDEDIAEGGYYTIPEMKTVKSTTSVPNFRVVRKGYGSIRFKATVDLFGITSLPVLREFVKIERGEVTVYPNGGTKQPAGEGLNVPAEVLLEKCFPAPDVSVDQHINALKSKPDTKFISYNAETGAYIFQVEHFSTYTC
jgi:nuclear pore complex protein Nup98-Nup96